ncbi:MAG: UvrD-helicase domain-containing protein [Planctomycetota bacterium]|nr:UvrD-helicase domain-containing protein [Planctomycetota bacterium]
MPQPGIERPMPSTPAEILVNLNPPQREAVETLSGPLLILAGAGSGKTRVVTRRIANLIAHGTRPWEILAITFTNKAAGEMRRRVEDLVGSSGAWVSTFHSFCARLLRREAEVLGLTPQFTIYDEDDASKVLDEIKKEMSLEDKRYSTGNLRSLISGLKSKVVAPSDLEGSSFHERVVQQIYTEYERALLRNQALDFDDLLLKAVGLLRDHEEVRERYRRRFVHLLVDEYQDTNGCQYQLVKLLGQGHRNVCVTGDPDQSIYSWRGADVRNILSFERDFPDARVVRLEQNYRSTKTVLAVASAVIKHNNERKEKELWTDNPEGEPVSFRILGDQELEAHEVASEIQRLTQDGRSFGDIAVFYRTNAQSRPFEQALIQTAVPYQLIGGTPFYERREVKDTLAYLRLIVNPKDDISFARIINVPRRGIGPSTVDQLAKKAGQLKVSMLEALDQPEWMERELKPKARKDLYAFARMMDKLRALPAAPVAGAVAKVLKESGLQESLREANETERLENLEQLVTAAATYDADNAPQDVPDGPPPEPGAFDGLEEMSQRQASIAGFLENAALLTPGDARKETADVVTLMTLHMAKGLEFPFVFLCGVEEGLLPMVRSSGGPMGIDNSDQDNTEMDRAVEEERRLFYVGVTRARERLYLFRTKFRMRFGKTDMAVPSRFLDEIPEKLLDVTDRAKDAWSDSMFGGFSYGRDKGPAKPKRDSYEAFERELDEFSEAYKKKSDGASQHKARALADFARGLGGGGFSSENSQIDEETFEVGDRVSHALFGEGTVEQVSGSGLSAKVKVHFRKVGPKLLLLSLAKLKKA